MSKPIVSVLMPVRDAAGTVARAISSICAQTFGDWEMVVVDDGSSDGTLETVEALARADARIRLFAGEARGLVPSLNTGLESCRGEFVARMDADDESHPERLAAQLGLLRERADIGVASCLVAHGGDRAECEGYALHVDWLNLLVTADEIARNRFVESPVAHPSVLFRRGLAAAHGGYRDGDFPEDYELWLRWMDAGVRFAKVPRALLTWHDSPARLSRTDPRYDPEAFFRMKAEWVAREAGRVRAGRPVWVWGAGRPTRKRAAHLEAHGVRIAGFIDIDPKKSGREVGGRPVVPPGRMPGAGDAFVLGYVASRGARGLIRAELLRHGRREGGDFLMCA